MLPIIADGYALRELPFLKDIHCEISGFTITSFAVPALANTSADVPRMMPSMELT